MSSKLPPPDRITVSQDRRSLGLDYPNGKHFDLPADVRGHGGKGGELVHGKREVTLRAVEPVGNYAVRIVFSDGHRNGLYTWKTFLDLALNQAEKWPAYLERLAAAGLGREPA